MNLLKIFKDFYTKFLSNNSIKKLESSQKTDLVNEKGQIVVNSNDLTEIDKGSIMGCKTGKKWVKLGKESTETLMIPTVNERNTLNNIVASMLLKKLGVSSAEYNLYNLDGQEYIGTKNFLQEGEALEDSCLELIRKDFESLSDAEFNDKNEELFKIAKCKIANLLIQDKEGNGNAGIITDKENKKRLAPRYDMEYAFNDYCYFVSNYNKELKNSLDYIYKFPGGEEFVKECININSHTLNDIYKELESKNIIVPDEIKSNQQKIIELSTNAFKNQILGIQQKDEKDAFKDGLTSKVETSYTPIQKNDKIEKSIPDDLQINIK